MKTKKIKALIAIVLIILFISCEKEMTNLDNSQKDNPSESIMEEYHLGMNSKNVNIEFLGMNFLARFDGEYYLIQGDIRISKDDITSSTDKLKLKGAAVYERSWPNSTVYYKIQDGFSDPQRIYDAINLIENNTNVIFKQKGYYDENYVEIVESSDGTYSNWVGRKGGRQEIGIADWALVGNIAHEFLHVLGHFHEQTRNDRDASIIVNYDHIEPGWESQYYKYADNGFSGFDFGAFDFNSIMLYSSSYYNGGWSMTNLEELPFIGQRSYLSPADISLINYLHPRIDVSIKGSSSLLNIYKTGQSFTWQVDFGSYGSSICNWNVRNGSNTLNAGSGNNVTLYALYDSSLLNGISETCRLTVNCLDINESATLAITVKDGYKLVPFNPSEPLPFD